MMNSKVGNRLLRIRQNMSLTQIRFAELIGISVGSYQGYERGEREIPSSLLWTLHTKFKCDPIWMLGGQREVEELPKSREIATNLSGEINYLYTPWTPHSDPYSTVVVDKHTDQICNFNCGDRSVDLENANLFSASPLLMEVVGALLNWHDNSDGDASNLAFVIAQARVAQKKAKGGLPHE